MRKFIGVLLDNQGLNGALPLPCSGRLPAGPRKHEKASPPRFSPDPLSSQSKAFAPEANPNKKFGPSIINLWLLWGRGGLAKHPRDSHYSLAETSNLHRALARLCMTNVSLALALERLLVKMISTVSI